MAVISIELQARGCVAAFSIVPIGKIECESSSCCRNANSRNTKNGKQKGKRVGEVGYKAQYIDSLDVMM